MSKEEIEIKGLIRDEVCIGTYGLVELKLRELKKSVEEQTKEEIRQFLIDEDYELLAEKI